MMGLENQKLMNIEKDLMDKFQNGYSNNQNWYNHILNLFQNVVSSLEEVFIIVAYSLFKGNLDISNSYGITQNLKSVSNPLNIYKAISHSYLILRRNSKSVTFILLSEYFCDSDSISGDEDLSDKIDEKNRDEGELSVVLKNGNFSFKAPSSKYKEQVLKNFDKSSYSIDYSKRGKEGFINSGYRILKDFIFGSSIEESSDRDDGNLKKEVLNSKYENSGIKYQIKNINLQIKKGALVGVIGEIGSGKTSLLKSLIGDLYPSKQTRIRVNGSISFVQQKPWILSKSIKDNIIFGQGYDSKKYWECLKNSGLQEDLRLFAKSDQTMLGLKGINLSGGQKMRLAIARALYSQADILVFDDPISSLDIEVGTQVMKNAIIQQCKGKTRIVATHALQYLKYFDYVYLMKKGEIVAEGTVRDIEGSELFKQLHNSTLSVIQPEKAEILENSGQEKNSKKMKIPEIEKQPQKQEQRIRRTEGHQTYTEMVIDDIMFGKDEEVRDIPWSVYTKFFQVTGGYIGILKLLVFAFLSKTIQQTSSLFSTYWTGLKQEEKGSVLNFALTRIGLVFIQFMTNLTIMNFNKVKNKETNFRIKRAMSFSIIHASINNFFDRVSPSEVFKRYQEDSNLAGDELFNNIQQISTQL